MQIKRLIPIFLLLGLILTACGSALAKSAETVNSVYTAVAATLTAQATSAMPATATLAPSDTPTDAITATPFPTMPQVPSISNAAAAPTSAPASSGGCYNSLYVSDVTIPDGTVLAPGESFTKTWQFQNSGSCAWTTAIAMGFVSGNSMSGSSTALTSAVSSGATVSISVAMVAPSSAGTYTSYWKLHDASGASFGEAVYVQIVVSDSASTLTPTATGTSTDDTETPTPEDTSIPTLALTSTSTKSPTRTPTITPQPTSTTAPSSTPVPTAAPSNTPAPTPTLTTSP